MVRGWGLKKHKIYWALTRIFPKAIIQKDMQLLRMGDIIAKKGKHKPKNLTNNTIWHCEQLQQARKCWKFLLYHKLQTKLLQSRSIWHLSNFIIHNSQWICSPRRRPEIIIATRIYQTCNYNQIYQDSK